MKSKFTRIIIILAVIAASLWSLKETYYWYYKTPSSRKDLANISPRKLEEMRDSIFSKVEDLRQIVKDHKSFQVIQNKKVYLDIRNDTDELILKMSKARVSQLLKKTRTGANSEKISELAEKFVKIQIEAKKEINQLSKIQKVKKLKKEIVKLGLDLAGGIHIVLGVDIEKLKEKLREKFSDRDQMYLEQLKKDNAWKDKTEEERVAEAKRLKNQFITNRIDAEIKNAPERARQVIQNRVDQFGVSEVSIRKGPNNTLIIQLPGANDVAAAEEILTRTGNLTMQLVDENFMRSVPYTYKGKQANVDDRYITDPGVIRKLKGLFKKAAQNPSETYSISLRSVYGNKPKVITIPTGSNIYDVQKRDQFGLPKTIGAVVLKRKILLEGNLIKDARVNYQSRGISNNPVVDFEMNATGAEQFAKVTRTNKGKLLAILLDGKMKSAPYIREEIPSGRGQISGNFSAAEASFLAGILKAGALKVPLKIEQLRVVGPSLGKEQIETGIQAMIIAVIAVIVFMILYYRVSGFIADLAVVLNLLLLTAILAGLGLTLTLPGIAGFILTIGMSVDANVIINERIKEEIRAGHGVEASIEAGYGKAFKTILDASVTTIMAALVISQVGTGPIRGFGWTLFVGIAASIFTALFFTKTIMMMLVSWLKIKRISIFPIFKKYPGRS